MFCDCINIISAQGQSTKVSTNISADAWCLQDFCAQEFHPRLSLPQLPIFFILAVVKIEVSEDWRMWTDLRVLEAPLPHSNQGLWGEGDRGPGCLAAAQFRASGTTRLSFSIYSPICCSWSIRRKWERPSLPCLLLRKLTLS